MSSTGSRFKVLGVCLLALCGMTALMAASAQGNWLESGAEVTVNKSVLAKAHTTLELAVPSLNFEFRCTTLASSGLKIVGKSTTAEGKLAFSGCTAWSPANLKGTEQPECNPEGQPIVWGVIALLKLLALTKNGTLLNVILFEPPEVGKSFTTIKIPQTCVLLGGASVTGSVVAECGVLEPANTFVQEDCSTSRAQHLLQAPAQTVWFESDGKGGHKEVTDVLKYEASKATLGGIAAFELESKNSWAGHV